MPGLYVPNVGPSFHDRAGQHASRGINSYSALTKDVGPKDPGKSPGGAISSGAGMGMAGYMMAGMAKGGMTGPQGAAVGAAVGIAAYYLS